MSSFIKNLLGVKHPAFWLVLFARIGGAFVFFIDPWIGFLLWAVLDVVDGQIWPHVANLRPIEYHLLDKYVDTLIYLVILVSSIPYGVFLPLLLLFAYRMIGQLVFWRTANELALIFFPNAFLTVWFWLVPLPLLRLPSFLSFLVEVEGLVFLLGLQIVQELYLHYWGPRVIFPWFQKNFWPRVGRKSFLIK